MSAVVQEINCFICIQAWKLNEAHSNQANNWKIIDMVLPRQVYCWQQSQRPTKVGSAASYTQHFDLMKNFRLESVVNMFFCSCTTMDCCPASSSSSSPPSPASCIRPVCRSGLPSPTNRDKFIAGLTT